MWKILSLYAFHFISTKVKQNFINENINIKNYNIDEHVFKNHHKYKTLEILKNDKIPIETKMEILATDNMESEFSYSYHRAVAMLFLDW